MLPVAVPGQAPVPTLGRARPAPLRREGPEKLTGKARYTDDLVFPGAWYGATIRSTEAHARLLGLELDPDFDWSTVVVMTAADIPGDNIVSSLKEDMPALAAGVIRHHAEPVALVAAPDRATLREARRRIRLRTEPLEPVLDPLASEPAVRGLRDRAAGTSRPASRQAALVVEGEYRVGHQEQLYIENQAMIAEPRPDGGITITGSHAVPLLRPRGAQAGAGPE